jgi:hypothetical protein
VNKKATRLNPFWLWNATVFVLLLTYLGWRALRASDYKDLAQRLGYTGPQRTFPIAFFREWAPTGAGAKVVWSRMSSYDQIDYFLVPIVGTRDSVLVQRFCYPMRSEHLKVDVEYRNGLVADVEVSGEGMSSARRITPTEAYARLGWKPS